MHKVWQNLSVSNKLYLVVGVMGSLIAIELLTLLFAMNTLSAVRGFVGGEGLWSKAQKDAVISLQKYAQSGNEKDYKEFVAYIDVPLGDRLARIELEKPTPDISLIYEGFLRGRIHRDDIDELVNLVRRFHKISYIAEALEVWRQADAVMADFIVAAQDMRVAVQENAPARVSEKLKKIDALNEQLTKLEDRFSLTLGQGSRWLESVLMMALLFAVLVIESTGLLLTITFSRTLSQGLRELNSAAKKVGEGDFGQKVAVRTGDELGQLAESLNKMAAELADSYGQRREAEMANTTKSQFLANMSHEIRTPVGTIVNYSELLKESDLGENDRAKFVDVIHRTGVALSSLINDILDLSKVEAGHLEIDKTTFSFSECLNEIQLMLQPRCAEKSVRLIMRQEGTGPDLIYTDPMRLRQILLNILGNAIKFTERGHVALAYRHSAETLIIEVQDTGVGLTATQSQHLFQLFSQVDSSTTRRYTGTGLGLILSRRLARLLGGDVVLAESVLGKGSKFVISVKLEDPAGEAEIHNAETARAVAKDALVGRKVLVIDDSEDNRFLIDRVLSKQGMTVSLADNGLEGAEKARQDDFDVIVMDIQMPVMDGYTATQKIRASGFRKPIIALTAHAMKGDRTKCLEAGCDSYLTKPIRVNALIHSMVEMLQFSHR
jgi:signal transduction histidine kinase/CheY-like chemotaxis protein